MEEGYQAAMNDVGGMLRLQQHPAADLRIDIRMPPISHGSQGTYDAVIVTKHPDHPEYDSVNAKTATLHSEKGATGTVTIEQYSPYVLSGSFKGTLYGTTSHDGPLRTLTKPISGRFTIGSPVLDDERVKSAATANEERRQSYLALGFPYRSYGLRGQAHSLMREAARDERGAPSPAGGFGQAGAAPAAVLPAPAAPLCACRLRPETAMRPVPGRKSARTPKKTKNCPRRSGIWMIRRPRTCAVYISRCLRKPVTQ